MLSKHAIHNLNRNCFCLPLNREVIDAGFKKAAPVAAAQCQSRQHLFAGTGVLLNASDVEAMTNVIDSIESLVQKETYLADKLASLPALARWQDVSGDGLIMSYDFHISDHGPKLIEVNTNAGGAFLANELLAISEETYPACCGFAPLAMNRERLYTLLSREWLSAGRDGVPKTAAIVDDNPAEQYLYPDMQIAQSYFERSGIKTVVVDIKELVYIDDTLYHEDQPIDFVYNRTTDFALSGEQSKALREAALSGASLVSPNPFHHALYADKSNFIDWTDSDKLSEYAMSDEQCDLLKSHVPATRIVSEENASDLFAQRKRLFFKPVDGYGSKAVFRGDKITRRNWDEMIDATKLGHGYVAQEIVPPNLRAVTAAGGRNRHKFDVRIYTLNKEPLIAAARIYQGQTTNFRTEGGGLAPVYVWSETEDNVNLLESQNCASMG